MFFKAFMLSSVIVILLLTGRTTLAQTYTSAQLVASAPLAWQPLYDPSARMSIGPDDGNIITSPSSTTWAEAIRYGGAQGLQGLLYDFTISGEGAPRAFGLARHGCMVNSERRMNDCVLARWEPIIDGEDSIMVAVLIYPTFQSAYFELDVHQGDSFSIEREGGNINFYRSTAVAGERREVYSAPSPFAVDGQSSDVAIEARTEFEPSLFNRKMSWGQKIYYCCP